MRAHAPDFTFQILIRGTLAHVNTKCGLNKPYNSSGTIVLVQHLTNLNGCEIGQILEYILVKRI